MEEERILRDREKMKKREEKEELVSVRKFE